MSKASVATVRTPAKINLGLEILGRREDGYHEIRSVMATVGLFDTLRISPSRHGVRISGVPEVATEDNLVTKAIHAFAEATGGDAGYDVSVDKQIPSPGGMGGASSNAAATLLALNALHDHPLSPSQLHGMASTLGSDIPFFLGTPVALASGTGTTLQPLPSLSAAAVLVVPNISIAAKTATLYGALDQEDFGSGASADSVTTSIRLGELPEPRLLSNAFTRPLYKLSPELEDVVRAMLNAGATHVALTGAGPGHYALLPTLDDAQALADAIRPTLPKETLVAAATLGNARIKVTVETS